MNQRSLKGRLARRVHHAIAALFGVLVLLTAASARADKIDDLSRTLEEDRSDKARIAAAVALGNSASARAVPSLIRALQDRSAVVRGLAANALGHIGDRRAVSALERSLGDEHRSVRARARQALARIRGGAENGDGPLVTKATMTPKEPPRVGRRGRVRVVVKSMAAKASIARALPPRMRAIVVQQLGGTPEIRIEGGGGPPPNFYIDGSITRLTKETSGRFVEVTCEVKLTVANSSGALLSIVSGGATVQAPRAGLSKREEREIQVEALDNAVRGAHQNLLSFILRQVAGK